MSSNYRPDLNRFLPAIVPGHALLAPNPLLPGKFRIVEDGERFATSDILKTRPIGKLVEPDDYQPWDAPTVIYDPTRRDSGDWARAKPIKASDYRYLQQTARDRSALPVLNLENGRIHDFALLLPAIDLLEYGRLVNEAAVCSMRPRPATALAS